VKGWDDPRMPTICGLRRRGYTPESLRDFADRIGVAKADSTVDIGLLEHCLREDLNKRALRVMVVLRPIKVIIQNYPEGKVEILDAENNPEDPNGGTRKIPFSREIYIEQEDFRENPPKKYFRLSPGREVRLKHAYYITCEKVIKDEKTDEILEIHCTYDPESRGGWTNDNRRVKGTLHWVSAQHSIKIEVRLYDHLFSPESPDVVEEGKTFLDNLNPDSLEVLTGLAEPGLAEVKSGDQFQFLRQGYFCVDPDSTPEKPVFNRAVSLRDSWTKIEQKG
jgi:glutaminyl-tRNA synthetase